MSKKECLKVQGCTEPCHDGVSCQSANNLDNVCVSPSESNKSCTGVWRDDLDVCTYPLLSQTLCASLGNSFFSCEDLSLDECSDCYSGLGSCSVNQTRLACKVVPTTACETKKECENKGGYCDDADYYTRFGTQTDDFGSCILPLDIAGWSGALPQCRSKAMVPQGCAPLAYTSKETCLNTPSAFWHPMATTKEECLSATGCITFDQINVHGQLLEKGKWKKMRKFLPSPLFTQYLFFFLFFQRMYCLWKGD
jgi:hypothetical protein